MTKARILANLISDNAELADGQISVAEVVGAAPLANPTFTGTASGTFSGPLTGNVTGDVTGDITGNVTGNVTGDVTAPEIDLTAISSTISDTAVDVFVYDTSKDSDGGAWRKRTQHTSWYNETLNTATRGSRKEFPAVAVIVAESNQLTIYDGDDPDLPMWMVFNLIDNESHFNGFDNNRYIGSVAALNGLICTGITHVNGYFNEISFIEDTGYSRTPGYYQVLNATISQRSETGITKTQINSTDGVVDRYINDIAMTVIPNAPIDAATGLPRVTTAVATDGGVSVIKDDGTVVDWYRSNGGTEYSHQVAFDENNSLYVTWGTTNGQERHLGYLDVIPSSDDTEMTDNYYNSYDGVGSQAFGSNGQGILSNNARAFAAKTGRQRLFLLDHNRTNTDTSSVCDITSDYNTGWMNGAIKLATLSDTDDTDVTGSELVTNGDFASGTSGWTVTNFSQSGGVITSSTATSQADQTITTVTNKKYVISFDITANHTDGQNGIYIRNSDGSSYADFRHSNETGSFSGTFTATGSSMIIRLYNGSTTGTISFDNISVRLAEEDRSVNGNGLQVFGTVTKNPVATGADLVAYSNWGLSNYLMQPPNADIAVNSDRTFVTWFKTSYTGNFSYLFSITGSSRAYGLAITTTDGYLYTYDNVNGSDNTSTAVADGNWHCAAMVHSGGYKKLYVDGKLAGTFAASDVTLDSDANLYLGLYQPVGGSKNYNLSGGSMALFRMSHTAASPEQIAKIYEDEKVLFQENAQATLYGSSDAVTALAYDDSTELLHVGTSAGRSDFQGLRRVNNTTNAVGAAISASNGMIVEE